jgi:hypothetical protein
MMAEFRPTTDSLKLLATMGDPVGAMLWPSGSRSLWHSTRNIDQKIEYLELFAPRDGAFGA